MSAQNSLAYVYRQNFSHVREMCTYQNIRCCDRGGGKSSATDCLDMRKVVSSKLTAASSGTETDQVVVLVTFSSVTSRSQGDQLSYNLHAATIKIVN